MAKPTSAQTNMPTGAEVAGFVTAMKSNASHIVLAARQKEEFKQFYALDQTPIPSEEGTWDKTIVESPKQYAKKLSRKLGVARLKFRIPLYHEEQKAEQERVNMTEQAVYGMLAMADDLRTSRPNGVRAQMAMAHQTNTTGFIIPCFILSEDEGSEHGEKIVKANLFIWEFANTYWDEGAESLKAICNVSWDFPSRLNDRYGLKLSNGGILVEQHRYIDREWELVEIGGEIVNYEGKGNRHGLGRVPARIFAQGAAEMPTDPAFTKYTAESCWADSSEAWLAQSRLASYRMTNIRRQVSNPVVIYFDGDKGDAPVVNGDPSAPSKVTFLDISKGQKMESAVLTPEMTRDAAVMESQLKQRSDRGSASDLTYGEQRGNVTAQGTQMLLEAGSDGLIDPQNNIEQAMTWFANECVRQYKDNEFEDVKVQGVDGKNNQFAVTIDAAKLITDRKISAYLNLDNPQDEMENVGKAIELWRIGKVSDQYIYDNVLKIDDPNAMSDQLKTEKIRAITGMDFREAQKIALDKKDYMFAMELERIIRQMQDRLLAQFAPPAPPVEAPQPMPGNGGGGNGGGVPGAMIPRAMPGATMAGAKPSNRIQQIMRTLTGRTGGR